MTKSDINKTLSALKRQQKIQSKNTKMLTLQELEHNYLTHNEQKLQRYKKLKTDKQRKKHLLEFFKARAQKYYNEVEQELNDIYNDNRTVLEIKVYVKWSKTRTWGTCPRCDGYIRFADNSCMQIAGGLASGCGYDKLSTTIADALNKCTAIKKMLYDKKVRNKTYSTTLEQESQYSNVVRPAPLYVEGGAGISSIITIFKALNFDVTHDDCYMFDILHATKK